MYILYHHPFSQNARRVVALFESVGLEYQLSHVALDKGEHLSQAFLAIPKALNITNWYRRVCVLEGFKESLPQA